MPTTPFRVFEFHRRRFYKYFYRKHCDANLADDLYQQTWMALWCHRDGLRELDEGACLKLCYTIARNKFVDYVRAKRRWRNMFVELFDVADAKAHGVEKLIEGERAEDEQKIFDRINRGMAEDLTPLEHDAINDKIDGIPSSQTAKNHATTAHSVDSARHRAKTKLLLAARNS